MPVDVLTEIEINRPRGQVASYAADPENATHWYENIESVEWKTGRGLAVGHASLSSRSDTARGGTRMTLRNRGRPSGFSKIAAPFMATAMRRANRSDLERLKRILETPSG
jgi:hypothetical protein